MITLHDDRTITGPLAEIIYVQPFAYSPSESLKYRPEVKPLKFLLHKRAKGETGTDLQSLNYVKLIKLGEEAFEEGRRRAGRSRSTRKSTAAKARSGR